MELQSAPKCPTCGAAAADAQIGALYTCPFCGAAAIVAAPPPIVQQLFVQPEVIRRVVMVDAGSGRTSLPCPRCNIPLYEGVADKWTVHGCGQCGGVWLDNAGSSSVVHLGPSPLVTLTEKAARAKRTNVDQTAAARCPLDGNELARMTVRGVELDVCATHGTWFDAGEVRRLASIYGGERIAAIGGATYDYDSAAKESLDASRYAKTAIGILGVVLGAAAGAAEAGSAKR